MTLISSIHQQLIAMQPALFRVAFLSLHNKEQAEDAVQEAILAVLEKPDNFSGNSSFRTYVTAILKYKIVDMFRLAEKERQLPISEDCSEADIVDNLFMTRINFLGVSGTWSQTDVELTQRDFFRVLESLLGKLPEKTAHVFMMREYLGFETEEICSELGLSKSNLWTLLCRARKKLRQYLNVSWLGQPA